VRTSEKTLAPTDNNGSNFNLDSDGKCAVVLMPVGFSSKTSLLTPAGNYYRLTLLEKRGPGPTNLFLNC
jgi:hypothetical protein